MKNAILLGSRVVNADHITSVRFDETLEDGEGPIHYANVLEDLPLTPPADSPEGRALEWWFCRADRVVLANPYRTIDLVALHSDHLRISAMSSIPGLYRPSSRSPLPVFPQPQEEVTIGQVGRTPLRNPEAVKAMVQASVDFNPAVSVPCCHLRDEGQVPA